MNMNRLRNVAVRMRPLAEERTLGSEAPINEAEHSDIVRPRRPNSDTAPVPPTSQRRIWDLEAVELTEEAARSPRATAVDRNELLPAKAVLESPAVTIPESGRTRTRMLGFHAQDHETDAIGAVVAAPNAQQFPAGFLVVIEGPGRGAFFAVSTSVSSIGRGADQDIALDFGDANISREGHASVVFDGEQKRFFLGHGHKANVVRRNGTPVLTTEEMMHGDLIRIGKTSLRFHAFCDDTFSWEGTDPATNASDCHE